MAGASEQEIFCAIFGSGFTTYPWWFDVSFVVGYNDDDYFEPHDGWAVSVSVEDPEEEGGEVIVPVTAAGIRSACRKIMHDKTVRPTLRKECSNLLFNESELDMDADDADVVMQYVAFDGEVIYC